MKILPFLLITSLSPMVQAEVFKCTDSQGKTNYQAKPCAATVKQQHMSIKSDPAKEAEAKTKLQAIESEYEQNKARQQEAEKQAFIERNQSVQAEALRQSAIAQQQQAIAQQRQAAALEMQNQQNNRPVLITTIPPVIQPPGTHPPVVQTRQSSPKIHPGNNL